MLQLLRHPLCLSLRVVILCLGMHIGPVAFAGLPAADPQSSGVTAITVAKDIVYRKVGDRSLEMDVAYPEDANSAPVILFLHGGGWISGNRHRFDAEIREAARRGFVAATATYRLARTTEQGGSADGFPAALHDVQAAVRFLGKHSAEYGADSSRIALWGESAGAHLALMAALTQNQSQFVEPQAKPAADIKIQAVIDWFGPVDLLALSDEHSDVRWVMIPFLGVLPEVNPDIYRAASPLSHVTAKSPPVFIAHGERDRIVPLKQAVILGDALRQAGVVTESLILPRSGHGFRGADGEQARTAAFSFLQRVFSDSTAAANPEKR